MEELNLDVPEEFLNHWLDTHASSTAYQYRRILIDFKNTIDGSWVDATGQTLVAYRDALADRGLETDSMYRQCSVVCSLLEDAYRYGPRSEPPPENPAG